MKFVLSILTFVLSCTLYAAVGKDQFMQMSLPTQLTYGKALEICQEQGFSHFLIKSISYSDEFGQTMEFNGISKVENGTLISKTIPMELEAPLGKGKIECQLLCFNEAPDNLLAVDVQDVFNLVAMMQGTQKEEVENSESSVHEVATLEELNEVINNSEGRIYLDCYSSRCPPCKILAPKFDQFAVDLSSKGTFLKVSLDNVPQMGQLYEVRSIPTLIVFENQSVVEKKTGLPDILNYFSNLEM